MRTRLERVNFETVEAVERERERERERATLYSTWKLFIKAYNKILHLNINNYNKHRSRKIYVHFLCT